MCLSDGDIVQLHYSSSFSDSQSDNQLTAANQCHMPTSSHFLLSVLVPVEAPKPQPAGLLSGQGRYRPQRNPTLLQTCWMCQHLKITNGSQMDHKCPTCKAECRQETLTNTAGTVTSFDAIYFEPCIPGAEAHFAVSCFPGSVWKVRIFRRSSLSQRLSLRWDLHNSLYIENYTHIDGRIANGTQ